MNMKISAAVLSQGENAQPYEETQPLALKQLTLAQPLPGELLLRIDAAGICHSDLSVINGDRPRPMPMALGHEAAATVIASGTKDDPIFSPGDQVVLVFLPACGECATCAAGEGYLCASLCCFMWYSMVDSSCALLVLMVSCCLVCACLQDCFLFW